MCTKIEKENRKTHKMRNRREASEGLVERQVYERKY